MSLLRPLIADLALLKAIMFVVVIAIYAINHLLSGIKKPPVGTPPRVPPAGLPTNRPRPAEAPQPTDRADVNAELSDFLRKAAAKRSQAGGRPTSAAPAKSEPSKSRKRKKSEPLAEAAKAVDERLSDRRALRTLDTRAIEDRSTQLGTRSGEAFDRQLGLLAVDSEQAPGATPAPTVELQSSVAVEMSTLLCNPQSLRGAIILNEILTRPEHRW